MLPVPKAKFLFVTFSWAYQLGLRALWNTHKSVKYLPWEIAFCKERISDNARKARTLGKRQDTIFVQYYYSGKCVLRTTVVAKVTYLGKVLRTICVVFLLFLECSVILAPTVPV